MGKIRDLYDARIRPMAAAERLQLARLILDDLAPSEDAVGVGATRRDDDRGDVAARIRSPRLARPEQAKAFAKQIVELAPDARL